MRPSRLFLDRLLYEPRLVQLVVRLGVVALDPARAHSGARLRCLRD